MYRSVTRNVRYLRNLFELRIVRSKKIGLTMARSRVINSGEVRQGAFMPDEVGMCWRHLRVIQIEEDVPFSDAD